MWNEPVAAFLFDMDGLLVDTEGIYMRVWSLVARRHGCDLPPEEFKRFIGTPSEDSAEWVVEVGALSVTPEVILEESVDTYLEVLDEEKPEPLPGVQNMIDQADALGIKRGLVSSTNQDLVLPVLKHLLNHMDRPQDPLETFLTLSTGDRVETKKPAPDLYLLAIKELGVSAEHCMAFEDSPAGTRSAKAAGCRTIAVPNMHISPEEVIKPAHYSYETMTHAYEDSVWLK